MKILAIGDFHGKFPAKLKREAKKVDLVVSVGDYNPFSLRKEFFKYVYEKEDKELWKFIGKKKVRAGILMDLKQGEEILKELNELGVYVITVTGNLDYAKWKDLYDMKEKIKWKWPHQDFFTKMVKKYNNIKVFDYSYLKFNNFVFIGIGRSTFPGKVKSKKYREYKKKLDILFKKFKKEKIILVSHNVPYNTKLDVIKSKDSPKEVKGKHYGSKLARRLIDKYKPILFIGGHMHENQGKCKIGKSLIINPGPAYEGKAAVININDKTRKVKSIKFLK